MKKIIVSISMLLLFSINTQIVNALEINPDTGLYVLDSYTYEIDSSSIVTLNLEKEYNSESFKSGEKLSVFISEEFLETYVGTLNEHVESFEISNEGSQFPTGEFVWENNGISFGTFKNSRVQVRTCTAAMPVFTPVSNRCVATGTSTAENVASYKSLFAGVSAKYDYINAAGIITNEFESFNAPDTCGVTYDFNIVTEWITETDYTLETTKLVMEPCEDTDGDGIADTEDSCPTIAPTVDVNSDGCQDPANGPVEVMDTDGDGIADMVDSCPTIAPTVDVNLDGCQDPANGPVEVMDTDGDGIADMVDSCPTIAPTVDVNLDGCQDPATGPVEVMDTDGDGIADMVDSCPTIAPTVDVNLDGCQDPANGPVEIMDTDGDGIADVVDSCPTIAPTVDLNLDGCQDPANGPVEVMDTDGDGIADMVDSCPTIAPTVDVNLDGCQDPANGPVEVMDTDGDGIADVVDSCPTIAPTVDVNLDGCQDPVNGPVEVMDTDGDGIADMVDSCPTIAPTVDVNLDGCQDSGNGPVETPQIEGNNPVETPDVEGGEKPDSSKVMVKDTGAVNLLLPSIVLIIMVLIQRKRMA